MPSAELVEGSVRVTTAYNERDLMSQLPGGRYHRELGAWVAPLSWATCVTLRGLFGTNLTVGEGLSAWAWKERDGRIIPAMTVRDSLHPQGDGSHLDTVEDGSTLKLFPYQRADVEFLTINERALLANPPGLGKTGVAIRTLQVLKARGENPFPALIVCPNSLKFTVWQDGFKQWAPELTVSVVDGSAAARRKALAEKADVYVINWDSLRLHSRLAPYGTISLSPQEAAPKELNALGHQAIIFDEAHRLKDPRAKQTRAAWAVAHQARFRYTLTGTPATNDIGDLWSLLHCVEPGWYPAKTKFLNRYAEMSHGYFGGATVIGINPNTRQELFSIVDPLMRRLPKQAALPQLPPKLPVQYRHTPMTAKQQKAYDQMRDMMVAQLNELLVAPNPLSKLTRLLQFAAASAEIDENGDIKLTDPSAKVDDMVDMLEEMGEEPLVVAAVSRKLIELAAKRLTKLGVSHGLVTGAQSPLERQAAVKHFQDGKIRVILLTLGAGAEGITLTRANTMLFMQESYSEVQNQQAEDRVHRIGSEGHAEVRIIKQVTPNSVEENKILVLQDKRARMEDIVRDRETLLKLLGTPVEAKPKGRAKADT